MTEILVPLSFFAAVFGIVYMYLTTRNRERMALIEKGANAEMFNKTKDGKWWLKFGIVGVGVGIGILLGNVLIQAGLDQEIAMPSMIFICAGLGLVVSYFVASKKKDENN